jgi:hypothetical protein
MGFYNREKLQDTRDRTERNTQMARIVRILSTGCTASVGKVMGQESKYIKISPFLFL